MAQHNELGRFGEALARDYLEKNGFRILHTNWRYSHYEIDIISEKKGLLHFVEVKMRSTFDYGQPEESVSAKKIRSLLKAINHYLLLHPEEQDFRLDILSITTYPGEETQYFFIEDVYTW